MTFHIFFGNFIIPFDEVIFFKMVETTNQKKRCWIWMDLDFGDDFGGCYWN